MKKLFLSFLFLLPFVGVAQFDKHFDEGSLRIDYYIFGDASHTQFALKEMMREPYWGGSKNNLIDTLQYGNYFVKVFDSTNGDLLFSRGYCNLFGEWQTTPEASRVAKGFEETVVMPYPKHPIQVALYYRDKDGVLQEGLRFDVSPEDYFIGLSKTPSEPIFEAWIGNEDYSKAVDIVILPDGYTSEEMDKFTKDCQYFVESLFSFAPYNRYQDRFNVRGVMAPSLHSGSTKPAERDYRNTAMNFSFWTFDSERYCMSTDNKAIRDLAGLVPYDQIYVLVNTQKYGGGGIYNFYCSSSSSNGFSSKIIIHELGHGFAGLADEYYDDSVEYEGFYNLAVEPWEPNITTLVNFEGKWNDMLSKKCPIPTPRKSKYESQVGVYEGGGYEAKGVYSPMMDCLMKTFVGDTFCPVCQRAIERMILYYAE